MPRFVATLYDPDDEVHIIGGDFSGMRGKVVSWSILHSSDPDVTHNILLDTPVTKPVTKQVQRDGGVLTLSEDVTFTMVGVPASHLEPV